MDKKILPKFEQNLKTYAGKKKRMVKSNVMAVNSILK